MKGIIANYKRGKHRVTHNQMIVNVSGVETKEDAEDFVGKTVTYNTGKKDINGEVRSAHGNSGALRVLFETGMPGQAIGEEVQIED